MLKAKKVEKLTVIAPNEVGTLANIAEELASSGINILHLGAYAKEESAYFIFVTSDNKKATSLLKNMGYMVDKGQTLEIEFENKPGALAPVAKKLSDNAIDIEYIFGTSADGKKVTGLITTSDDDRALEIINQ